MSKRNRATKLHARAVSETERTAAMMKIIRSHQELMVRVARLQESLDFWRNIQTANFFGRGMGYEGLMTDAALSVKANRQFILGEQSE